VKHLTPAQAAFYRSQRGPEPSEHKKAILLALRELTGTNGGASAASWREKLRMP
jgi:hypothetical protein